MTIIQPELKSETFWGLDTKSDGQTKRRRFYYAIGQKSKIPQLFRGRVEWSNRRPAKNSHRSLIQYVSIVYSCTVSILYTLHLYLPSNPPHNKDASHRREDAHAPQQSCLHEPRAEDVRHMEQDDRARSPRGRRGRQLGRRVQRREGAGAARIGASPEPGGRAERGGRRRGRRLRAEDVSRPQGGEGAIVVGRGGLGRGGPGRRRACVAGGGEQQQRGGVRSASARRGRWRHFQGR